MHRKLTGLCAVGTLLAGASLTASASAAYTWNSPYSYQDTFGNTGLFYSKYRWEGRTLTQEESDGEARARAQERFYVKVGLFGTSKMAVDVEAYSEGFRNKSGGYAKTGFVSVEVLDQDVYQKSADDSQEWSKDISKTLFKKKGTFELAGFIPITVEGEVKMGMHAGLSTGAYSAAYLGRSNSHYGTAGVSFDNGGDLDAILDAEAGWSGVAAVGVTSTFRLLDVDVTPSSYARHVFPFNADKYVYIQQKNKLPIHVRSMSGKVEIRGEYVGQTYKDEIFRWNAPVDKTWTAVDDEYSFYL